MTPVYNTRPYFSECIDSVIRQTYFNCELVHIDDGSIDD
ncbi:MAG: glycosyltransferase [Lachnospiraceae bacterium]|nr:glycosyltransferase [Lachnospiraceae bacterium]